MDELSLEFDVPEAVREIARRLEDAGFETWTVGGGVRDALLGRRRSDWDLTTAAKPEAVRELFRATYPIGVQFGTVGVRGEDGNVYEVTTFRRDIETDGRHAVVEYSDTLDEDLARRDFTINAIAYHPLRRTLHDPYFGREDLRKKTLRCVGDPLQRFAEDFLRILRGLRFAGSYSLQIEAKTWAALKDAVPNLRRLSGERVREELLKVLASPTASPALQLYRDSGAMRALIPELGGLTKSEWGELTRAIDAVAATRFDLRLALLFASTGDAAEALMSRLRFSNAEIRGCVELGRVLKQPLPVDVVEARRWVSEAEPLHARDALRLHCAQAQAAVRSGPWRSARLILGVLRRGDPVRLADLAIDGEALKELGLVPGPELGRALAACLDAVIRDPQLNDRGRLMDYARRHLLPK